MSKKKIAIRIIGFLMIFLVILNFYGKLVITHRPYETTVKQFYAQSETRKMDIVFFGTSHTFSSYNPRVFDNMLHINSYNLGISSQYMFSTEYLINEALKYQKPELVVIDIYYKFLNKKDDTKELRKQYNAIDYTKFSIDKLIHVFTDFPYELYFEALFPGIREHDKWKKIDLANIQKQGKYKSSEGQYNNGFMGYYQQLDQGFEQYDQYDYKSENSGWKIDESTKDVLRDVINKLRKENVKVLFVTSPYIETFSINGYGEISSEISEFFQEENQDYIDLNYYYNHLHLNSEDYKDASHLNLSGANKVSEFLAKYIKNNYSFTDRSKDKEWVERNNSYFEYYLYNEAKVDNLYSIFNEQYQLTENININNISLLKNDSRKYTLLLNFDYEGDLKELNNFKMSFRGVPSKEEKNKLSTDRKKYGYEYWDFIPKPVLIKGKKYLVTEFKTNIKEFDKLSFQLVSSENNKNSSNKKVGEKLLVKNVTLH